MNHVIDDLITKHVMHAPLVSPSLIFCNCFGLHFTIDSFGVLPASHGMILTRINVVVYLRCSNNFHFNCTTVGHASDSMTTLT